MYLVEYLRNISIAGTISNLVQLGPSLKAESVLPWINSKFKKKFQALICKLENISS